MRLTRKAGAVAVCILALVSATAALVAARLWGDPGPRLRREGSVAAVTAPDSLPELVLLSPGAVVQDGTPPGWSHLILKSVHHLESGDINTLPGFAKTSATKFRTVILADVRRDGTRGEYRLRRVGAGLCLDLEGRDTIISSDSLKAQGVQLNTLDGVVLGRAEKTLGRSRLAARTPTFTLYDSYVELADARGKHHSILLRYALVVDPATGALRTAYWHMPEAPTRREPIDALVLMPAALIFKCGIHVAAHRLIGNFASSWGFAMTGLPPGDELPPPPGLPTLARGEPAELHPAELEAAVRRALGDRAAPSP